MPSCSGNHKQVPMTGGGVRSMLRRAKSGLRKLTKRNKPTPTRNEEYEMVDFRPKIATIRFGSKSKYNNRAAHRQGVADLEQYVKQLQEEVKELTQQSEIAQNAHSQCMSREKKNIDLEKKNIDLEKKNKELYLEIGSGAKAHIRDFDRLNRACHQKDYQNEKLTKALDAAVAKLAECESGKASLGRRHAAAAKMYRQAHVDRTLGALDTEDALDKAIEAEELLAKAHKRVKDLQDQYERATKHAGTKSEKVTELGMKLNAASAKVAELESKLGNVSIEADAALNMLQKVTAAGMSDRRRAESAERRKQQASSRAANLELESDVLKAQYAAAAERLENDTLKHSQELNHKNKLLSAARNQFADVEANKKLKSKAAKLAENNTITRRLKAGVQSPKSSKQSKQSNWFTSGGHLGRG